MTNLKAVTIEIPPPAHRPWQRPREMAALDYGNGGGAALIVRGGRTGEKIHRALCGGSSLGCGRWVKHAIHHFALRPGDVLRVRAGDFCEHCFGTEGGEAVLAAYRAGDAARLALDEAFGKAGS